MDGFFDTIIELLQRYIGQPILFVMENYVGLFESIVGPPGFMLAFALPIAAGFALIFALKPGQAFIWFRRDLIDGIAVAVRIRYNPNWRSEGSDRRDTYDWRHNSVIIEVPTPNGPRRHIDKPVEQKNLAPKIRRQVYKRALHEIRYSLNVSDTVEERNINQAIHEDYYDFPLRDPVPVRLIPPKQEEGRIWFRVVKQKSLKGK